MGRLDPKSIFLGLLSIAILSIGCSEVDIPTGPDSGDTMVTSDSDGDNQDNTDDGDTSGSSSSEPVVTEFPLDDLTFDCSWDSNTFPNPYNNMSFDEQPRWGVCSGLGVGRMSPPVINPMDSRFHHPDEPHTTVAHLDEPVDEVSLHTANHRPHRSTGEFYSNLIAYDENGEQIDIDENTINYIDNDRKATRLTVSATGGKKIHSFGLSSFQNATYFDNFRFTVNGQEEDVTPPEIAFTVEQEELWPPNHQMVLAVSGVHATDNSGDPVKLDVGVESSEPENGQGDGDTAPDWELVENDDGSIDVYLRAERSGNGEGRTYTVSIRAEDSSGNVSEDAVDIGVPHDQRTDANDNDNGNGNGEENGDNGDGNGNGNDHGNENGNGSDNAGGQGNGNGNGNDNGASNGNGNANGNGNR